MRRQMLGEAFRRVPNFAALCAAAIAGCMCSPMLAAAPVVTGVDFVDAPGGTVTIRGQGFGTKGPSLVLYDNFDRDASTATLRETAPVGSWMAGFGPVVTTGGRSGTMAMKAFDQTKLAANIARLSLGGDRSELFVSYWTRVPPGTYFPGSQISGLAQFPIASSWKFAWVSDLAGWGATDGLFDLCLPTHIGSGIFQNAGNSLSVGTVANTWWSWNNWVRVSVWLRVGAALDDGLPTYFVFQALSRDKGLYQSESGTPVRKDGVSEKFTQLNIPGWIREAAPMGEVNPLYDDVYVTAGPGAAARIELSDSKEFGGSKDSVLLLVKSWSDTEIVAQIPPTLPTGFKVATNFLHVFDWMGNTGGGVPLAKTTPQPPSPVVVQ